MSSLSRRSVQAALLSAVLALVAVVSLVTPMAASAQSIFDQLQVMGEAAEAQQRATRPVPEADAAWADGVASLKQGIEDLNYDLQRDGGQLESYHLTMDCVPIYSALASFNHAMHLLAQARGEPIDYDNRYRGSNGQLVEMQAYIDETDAFFYQLGCKG